MNINEKIKSLNTYHTGKGGASLSIVHKGELIKNEDSFLKRLIKSGENFILLSGGFEAIMWKRFAKTESSDYFYMSDSYYDAVAFKPKRDVHFLGFGFMNQYEKLDFKLKFKYNVDGNECPETELNIT